MTTGGTESIIMACKAYRDYAKEHKGITKPNIVMPTTAHSGFDKAAQYLRLHINTVPIHPTTTEVDIRKMEKAINRNTVMVCKKKIMLDIYLNTLCKSLFILVSWIRTKFSLWYNG